MKPEGKKVLLLTQYFFPDITAASFRMYELYKYLRKKDFKVIVVTSYPHRVETDELEPLEDVFRVKVNFPSYKNKLKYIYYYLEFVLKSLYLILAHRAFGASVIIVSSPPIFVAIEAFVISKIFHKKFLLDIRDLWPDSIADLKKIRKTSFIYSFLKKIEIYLYRNADYVFCVSNPMKEYIEEYNKKVVVIYNGITISEYSKYCKKEFNNKVIQNRKPLRLIYAGNIGMAQDLNFLFNAAEQFHNELEVFLIGSGLNKDVYEQQAQVQGILNIHFLPPMRRADLLEFIEENSDALLLTVNDGFAFEKTIPSKVFDYLLLNKPIIYHLKGEGKEILEQSKCGVYFELFSESFIGAIRTLKENYSNLLLRAFENNCNILKDFLREKQFQKIEKILLTFF
ncbi:glycosyltransferase family 4 protein [Caldisericum sp.]|jgi:glycosyltransferase involved in cell wall biosynthesis|uniref:glycosyltransferase family 4 protein n=1 Tax=Caldisericum sp. TaxID=2499687 RepID=UPI003D129E3A